MSVELKVVEVTRYTVHLKWQYTDDNPLHGGADPTGYALFRARADDGANLEMLALLPGKSYIDHGLVAATEYTYRIDVRGLPGVGADGTPIRDFDQFRLTTEPENEYPDAIAFFTGFLGHHFGRYPGITGFGWCTRWWAHPEARKVVNELWRSYEAHRPPDDPTEPSSEHAQWLAHLAYPLMSQIMNKEGTFKGCNVDPVGGHQAPMKAVPLAHGIDTHGRYAP